MSESVSWMRRALDLAAKARPISAPNPAVGCVIVRDGQVIGEGFTQPVGSDHAEIQAIKDANRRGFSVEGATVFVTLEPCSHFGHTPPCALRLIAEKVARVVVACADPNPLVSGRGIRMLKEAGIDVDVGLMQKEAWLMNAGFMTRMSEHRPWVRMKVAMSLDGFTALPDGKSQWITSETARNDGHRYRSEAGAILTGIGTVLADNPTLTARPDGVLSQRQPLRVLCDSTLRVDPSFKLLQGDKVLIACAKAEEEKARSLTRMGHEVVVFAGQDGRVDLRSLLKELAHREINEVHVEAGSTLNAALLEADLVDEILCYVSPKILGRGRAAFPLAIGADLSVSSPWEIAQAKVLSPDVRLILRKKGK